MDESIIYTCLELVQVWDYVFKSVSKLSQRYARVIHKNPEANMRKWYRVKRELNILLELWYSHLHLCRNGKRLARMFVEKAAASIHEPRQTRTADQSAAEEARYVRYYTLIPSAKFFFPARRWLNHIKILKITCLKVMDPAFSISMNPNIYRSMLV